MVMELILAKGEVGGPLSLRDVLVAVGIALTYLSVIVFVLTSERRTVARSRTK